MWRLIVKSNFSRRMLVALTPADSWDLGTDLFVYILDSSFGLDLWVLEEKRWRRSSRLMEGT
jgi:hypothetical protein